MQKGVDKPLAKKDEVEDIETRSPTKRVLICPTQQRKVQAKLTNINKY